MKGKERKGLVQGERVDKRKMQEETGNRKEQMHLGSFLGLITIRSTVGRSISLTR